MAKTIRRNPMSVSTVNLDEKYINFMEYKGLCTNKNYVTVDQETFSEVNNMYVNQDKELSTRPPIKNEYTIDITTDGVSTETVSIESILDIKRINDKVFYHIKGTDSKYYLLYPVGDNKYKPLETSAQIYLMWFNYGYGLFAENYISLIFYGKDNTVEVFKNADAVYIPITKVITGATIEVFQSENVFTSSKRERYKFVRKDEGIITPTDNLIDKYVTIIIDNESYTVKFQKYQELTFYKKVGHIPTESTDDWHYSVGVDEYKNVTYIASTSDAQRHYISVDGNIWHEFTLQVADENYLITPKQYPVLSDDGRSVYCCVYDAKSGDTTPQLIIYKKNVVITEIDSFSNNAWSEFDKITITNGGPTYAGNKGIYYNLYNGTKRTDNFYILVGMDGNYTQYIDMIAFGSCIKNTVSYALSICQKESANNLYYIGYLLFISDGETNGNTFLFEDWSEATSSSDILDSTKQYACQNLNNKIGITWQGTIGLLYFSKFGSTIHEPAKNSYSLTVVHRYNGKYKITGKFLFNTLALSLASPKYFVQFVLSIDSSNQISINQAGTSIYDIKLYDNNLTIAYATSSKNQIYKYTVTGISKLYDDDKYDYSYATDSTKTNAQYTATITKDDKTYNSKNTVTSLLVSNSSVFTNVDIYYDNNIINVLKPGIPLYNGGTHLVWYDSEGNIYSNQYTDEVVVDNVIQGDLHYIVPEHSIDFITSVLSSKNVLYTSSKELIDVDKTLGKNLIYAPVDTSRDNVFTDNITGLVNFSQTAIGIFLETCAYELTYDNSSSNYYLTKTKLQLGNKRGSDILLSYDGNNIFITNIKGLSTLNYQDFVQSTEQIYKYLTENIIETYKAFATDPIKLCQYKDYLILYKTTSNVCLVYDLRSASWWVWTFEYNPEKIIYDGTDLLFLSNGKTYVFDFDSNSVYDNEANPFDWSFTTQKLHFGAPNNYKHIRSVSVVTEQNVNSCRFKLKFINYRNLNNLSDTDTVEYEIDQFATMIKKVNFIKTNAFQFQVSNDVTDKKPKSFVTSNISIKYRITERLR